MIIVLKRADPPLLIFAILSLTLFAFKVDKILLSYQRTVGIDLCDSLLATLAGLPPLCAIAKVVPYGFVIYDIPFFHTPKMRPSHGLSVALVEVREEVFAMFLLWGVAAGIVAVQGVPSHDLLVRIVMLLMQSLSHLAVLVVALLSSLPKPCEELVNGAEQIGGRGRARHRDGRLYPPKRRPFIRAYVSGFPLLTRPAQDALPMVVSLSSSSLTFESICELVRRSSATPPDTNHQVLVIHRLEAADFALEPIRTEEVDNFRVRRGGDGPALCLAGYADAVPTGSLQVWQHQPFDALADDQGMLYRCDVADMKGSLASTIAAAKRFVADHPEHKGTIALFITNDEEGPVHRDTRVAVKHLATRGECLD